MKNHSKHSVGTIKNVALQLRQSPGPITKVLRSGNGFSVFVIGLNNGDVLPRHTTDRNTKLVVLSGSVLYEDTESKFPLFEFDEHEIPVGVVHSLTATHKSICLLIKGE